MRSIAGKMGVAVTRSPVNRFDAMEEVLAALHARGFAPTVVVDIGANVGLWTDAARRHFEPREFHLVEPQPACVERLRRFHPPLFTIHPVALTKAGVSSVSIVGSDALGVGTGAGVVPLSANTPSSGVVPATTLDDLLGGRWSAADRILLKLDVESHELPILEAGPRILELAEVVILEFQLFQFDGNEAPTFADLHGFMAERGFVLYDFAGLASRPRDGRLRTGDAVFVKGTSPLLDDSRWA